MNSSPTPANNENVAYGPLLAQASKLKRADQVNLVRALAGQLGMIAMFPAQLQGGVANSSGGQKAAKKEKKRGPAKQAPTNPLSGSPEKLAFDSAKKAVAKATKEGGGQKLAPTNPLVLALERAKDQYFRALSSAKGQNTEDADASSDEEEGEPEATKSPPAPAAKAATPPKAGPSTPVPSGKGKSPPDGKRKK